MTPKERVQQAAKVILARNQNLEKMYGLKTINLGEIMHISLGFAELLPNERGLSQTISFMPLLFLQQLWYSQVFPQWITTQKTFHDFTCFGKLCLMDTQQNPCKVKQTKGEEEEGTSWIIDTLKCFPWKRFS